MALKAYWYPLCRSRDLGRKPLARRLLGRSVALFRDEDGGCHALEDRCRHRSARLSEGKVVGCALRCPYHGWEFTGSGECVKIPGIEGFIGRKRVVNHAVVERDDLVWVYGESGVPLQDALDQPVSLPQHREPGYRTGIIDFGEMDCSAANILENFTDCMHPAYVHPGMFYTQKRHSVRIEIKRYLSGAGNGIEARFHDEPSPTESLLGRLYAEPDAEIYHTERFLVPTFHQLEYRIGRRTHLITTQLVVPVEERRVRLLIAYALRLRFPASLLGFLFPRFIRKTIREDEVILQQQEDVIREFGEEAFSSTRLDALGLAMRGLLNQLSTGKRFDELEVKAVAYRARV